MASIYPKKGKLYISWWDPEENKTINRSLKLPDTPTNRKTAQKLGKELQKKMDKIKESMDEQALSGASLKEAFEHFKANNSSKHIKTQKDYERFFKKFTETFDQNRSCKAITKLSSENWINEIKKLPLQPNSIHAYFKQFNHFLNFLFEYGYVQMFKINRDVKTKPEVKEKITFRDEDIYSIFDKLDSKNRNFQTAINLLFYTGLRSSDILEIKVENIDLGSRILRYYSPKRKKYREISFHKDLVGVLTKAIGNRTKGILLNYCRVESLGRAVSRYFKDLKINGKGYSARTFRKTFITLCRSRYDMDASIVRELVGHEHGNTTDRYYHHITTEKMKLELEKFVRPINPTKPPN